MRLEGQKAAGFFPTPPGITADLIRQLSPNPNTAVIDPCCGSGDALRAIRAFLKGKSWGIELEEGRAKASSKGNTHVRHGDALEHSAEGFSMLFLNPPYDDGPNERLEKSFLRQYATSLVQDGLLVFIIPEYVLADCTPILTRRFRRMQAFRFPKEHYGAHQQIAVFGLRNEDDANRIPQKAIRVFDWDKRDSYQLPNADNPHIGRQGVSDAVMLKQAGSGPLWRAIWHQTKPVDLTIRPLMPLREGHVAMLVATGRMNGVVVEHRDAQGETERYIVRGSVEKTILTRYEPHVKVETEKFVAVLNALNLKTGEITTIK